MPAARSRATSPSISRMYSAPSFRPAGGANTARCSAPSVSKYSPPCAFTARNAQRESLTSQLLNSGRYAPREPSSCSFPVPTAQPCSSYAAPTCSFSVPTTQPCSSYAAPTPYVPPVTASSYAPPAAISGHHRAQGTRRYVPPMAASGSYAPPMPMSSRHGSPLRTSYVPPVSRHGSPLRTSFVPPVATSSSYAPPVALSGSYAPPVAAARSYAPPVAATSGSYAPPIPAVGSYAPPPNTVSGSYAPPSVLSGSYAPPVATSGSYAPPAKSLQLYPLSGSYAPPAKLSYVPPVATSGSYAPPVATTSGFSPVGSYAPPVATTSGFSPRGSYAPPSSVSMPMAPFTLPPPASLTHGLADPEHLEHDRHRFEEALDAQLKKQTSAVLEESKIQRKMLAVAAKTQLEQYKLDMHEKLRLACLEVDRDRDQTISGLHETALTHQTAAEEKAAMAIAQFHKVKAMNDMAAKSHQLNKHWQEGEAKFMAQLHAARQSG